jgi:8-oxo-dGTP pyrophosphatase MutT (NUDIX family)
MEPKFNNRPNEELKLENRTLWISRSVAIVGIVLGKFRGDTYVLIEERSKTMMDQPGKWCLPCGYIDWDENGLQAITRELYEETFLYLPTYNRFLLNTKNPSQPFYVNTEATENRQNIVLYYGFVYDFDKEGLPLEPLSYINHEISDVRWVKLNDVNEYGLVFGHDRRIVQAEKHFSKYLLPWWKRWIKKLFS